MKHYQISVAKLKKWNYWNEIVVSMVTLYENWKYVKHIPLTQEVIDEIKGKPIAIEQSSEQKLF